MNSELKNYVCYSRIMVIRTPYMECLKNSPSIEGLSKELRAPTASASAGS